MLQGNGGGERAGGRGPVSGTSSSGECSQVHNWHPSVGLGSSLALSGTAEMPEGVSWVVHGYTGLLVKHHIPAEKNPRN